MHKAIRFFVFFAVLVSVMGANTLTAEAQIGFGLRPQDQSKAYFVYQAQPGDVIEDAFYAINSAPAPVTLLVRQVTGHTAVTGGVAFPTDALEGTASWVTIMDEKLLADNNVMVLEARNDKQKVEQGQLPGNIRLIPFNIKIPADTPPGEYVIGFLATQQEVMETDVETEDGDTSGFRVRIVPQMGLPIYLTVGEPKDCHININSLAKNVQANVYSIKMNMTNVGNTHFKGSGRFTLTDKTTGEVIEKLFEMGYWVMGDTVDYPLIISPLPEPGQYKLDVTLESKDIPGCSATYSEDIEITDKDKADSEQQVREQEEAEARGRGEYAQPQQSDPFAHLLTTPNIIILSSTFLISLGAILAVIVYLSNKKEKKEGQQEKEVRINKSDSDDRLDE